MTPKVMQISTCTTGPHASTCNHEHAYTHTPAYEHIYMQNPFLDIILLMYILKIVVSRREEINNPILCSQFWQGAQFYVG